LLRQVELRNLTYAEEYIKREKEGGFALDNVCDVRFNPIRFAQGQVLRNLTYEEMNNMGGKAVMRV